MKRFNSVRNASGPAGLGEKAVTSSKARVGDKYVMARELVAALALR